MAFQSQGFEQHLTEFHNVEQGKPKTFTRNGISLKVARLGRTLRVTLPAATDSSAAAEPQFAPQLLRAVERGGLIKLQIELRNSTEKDPATGENAKDANGDPIEYNAVISTVTIIPYSPWTIVFDEKGAVDPRFRAGIPAFMPCPSVAFKYSQLDARTAPSEIVLKATVRDVTSPAPIVLRAADSARELKWDDELKERAVDDEVHMAVEARGRAIGAVSLTRETVAPLPTRTGQAEGQRTIFAIELDRTGVVSWEYLNRRRPPRLEFSNEAYLRFTNKSPDRQFIITFAGIPDSERAALLLANVRVTNCRDTKCQASVHVGANGGSRDVPLAPLRNAFMKGVVGNVVSFQLTFFDDDATPTFSRGYFSFVESQFLAEPASATSWSAGASIVGQRDPDLSPLVPKGHKSPSITFDTPWVGDNRSHVNGGATLGLRQTLGSRAEAEVELSLKKGDFGADASAVQASKYFGNVYAIYNATLTGGRFDLIAPTSGIALAESGEAVNVTMPLLGKALLGAARIFRKEITDGSFTADEEQKVIQAGGSFLEKNHTATLLQMRDIRLGARLRASLFYLDGDARRGRSIVTDATKNPPARELIPYEVEYRTFGTDMSWTYRDLFFTGGVYRSRRTSDARRDILLATDNVNGTVGLVSASYTERDAEIVKGKLGVDWVLTGTAAMGGSYVGETQGFVPDALFLNTFVPALKEPSLTIGPGLTNKLYFGATWMTPKWGPIKWLAEQINFPVSDIETSTLTFRFHHYRLRGGSTTHLATEGNVEFRLESPKGVRYTLTFAGLQPGAELKRSDDGVRLIDGFQFAARIGVSVRFAE